MAQGSVADQDGARPIDDIEELNGFK